MKKRHSYFNTQFITSGISTTLVLMLLGTIVLFVLTARNLSEYVRENINVSVLISDDLSQKQIDSLRTDLSKAQYLKTIEYISKEDALADAAKAMGSNPAEFLGYNPFTASFEIKVKAEYATDEGMSAIIREIKNNPSVVDVIYQKDLVKAVNSNIQKVSMILLIIAVLFTYISFALINNTVRLSIFSQRFIISTMKLVGARWSFIRRPFLMKGLVLGAMSAVCADAILYGAIQWFQRIEPDLHLVLNIDTMLITGAAVFIFGLVISVFCTLVSLQKYLRMSTNELYYV